MTAVLLHKSFLILTISVIVYCNMEEDQILSTAEIIYKYGYPFEEHKLRTTDNYILTLHRIPYGKTSKRRSNNVIFLQHCLLCSSAYFVYIGNKSLAFQLADDGYDVWMGNIRGNTYSRNHTIYDPDVNVTEYWSFSLDEMGLIDLPQSINYVLNKTKMEKLFYVGHSLGSTLCFIMTSSIPEMNEKIIVHFGLAPVVYLKHVNNFRTISKYGKLISNLLGMMGFEELFSANENNPFINYLFFHGSGVPAGTSRQVITHTGQLVNTGRFLRYDFGEEKNLKVYSQPVPPDYNLKNSTVDVWIFYSLFDWLISQADLKHLINELCCTKFIYEVYENNFGHMDFLISPNASRNVYEEIIYNLDKYYS